MSALPSVSVILPVKNGACYLAESIRSVLAQDHRPVEILIIDDESTDETPMLARSFEREGVRYVRNDPPLGVAGSCNFGISMASGQLLAFTSHDDIWLPHKLRLQAERFLARPELDYCIGLVRPFLDPDASGPPAGFPRDIVDRDVPGYVLEALVARRRAFARAGVFDVALRGACDTDWYARARGLNLTMEVIEHVLLHKRLHDQNATYSSASAARLNRELLRVAKRSVERARESR